MIDILLFDTSIATKNLGDHIILDSIRSELDSIFPYARYINTPTHESISNVTYNLLKKTDLSFVAGTNLLSSNLYRYNQWKINILDSFYLYGIILMGVGWWQYQNNPDYYSAYLYRNILNKNIKHSVRDSYTMEKMISMGFDNVVNTGCPTTWNLTSNHCNDIKTDKSDSVVFTLTDYNQDPESDKKLLSILLNNYDKIYYWPQGLNDQIYLESLQDNERISIIRPSLKAYDELLSKDNIDYVGTRLHAGIRALQHKRRSIVIGIDNRAIEMGLDINLPVVNRNQITSIHEVINSKWTTNIKLNIESINLWKAQFLNESNPPKFF